MYAVRYENSKYNSRYGDHKLMRFLQGMDLLHEHV